VPHSSLGLGRVGVSLIEYSLCCIAQELNRA
jgi:hypothetical protein